MTETNCSHSPINQSIKGTDNARRPRSKRQHPGEAHHTHAAEGRVPRPDGDWVQPCLASTKAPLTPPKLHRIHEYACHPATYRQTPFHPETFLESQLHNVESSCYEERCGEARRGRSSQPESQQIHGPSCYRGTGAWLPAKTLQMACFSR